MEKALKSNLMCLSKPLKLIITGKQGHGKLHIIVTNGWMDDVQLPGIWDQAEKKKYIRGADKRVQERALVL